MSAKKTEATTIDGERLSELELALTVLWNSVRRWLYQRGNSSVAAGLAELDVFLLHLLVYRNKKLRGGDLAFALAIDDMHLVSYSLKKLAKLGLVASEKVGKEVFYRSTAKGREHYTEFLEDRRAFLEPAMKFMVDTEQFGNLTASIRALSGAYEQAARSAASSKGP